MKCPRCDGTGDLPDGKTLRDLREAYGVSLRAVARALELSISYISDLERDKRNWTASLGTSYLAALESLRTSLIAKEGHSREEQAR